MWNGVSLSEAKGQWNKMPTQQQESFTVNHIPPDLLNLFDQVKQANSEKSDAECWSMVQMQISAHPMKPTTGPPDRADAGSGKIEHYPPEETQGYGVNYPNQIKAREAFKWTTPFKLLAEAGKLLIKGTAITIGKTRNKGTYTRDELVKSARTLAGKPIYHNHLETVQAAKEYLAGVKEGKLPGEKVRFDPNTIPPLVRANIEAMIADNDMTNGLVDDAEFEDEGVEYTGEITRPTAIAMADAGLIKGPSIGAYPRNRNLAHPQGIIYTDISIITPPETPADPDATMKIMEKLREMFVEPPLVVQWQDALIEQYDCLAQQRIRIARRQQNQISEERNRIRNHALSNDEY